MIVGVGLSHCGMCLLWAWLNERPLDISRQHWLDVALLQLLIGQSVYLFYSFSIDVLHSTWSSGRIGVVS